MRTIFRTCGKCVANWVVDPERLTTGLGPVIFKLRELIFLGGGDGTVSSYIPDQWYFLAFPQHKQDDRFIMFSHAFHEGVTKSGALKRAPLGECWRSRQREIAGLMRLSLVLRVWWAFEDARVSGN